MLNLEVIIAGVALASLWFWLDVIRRDTVRRDKKLVIFWGTIIIPQGIIIAMAARVILIMAGVLDAS